MIFFTKFDPIFLSSLIGPAHHHNKAGFAISVAILSYFGHPLDSSRIGPSHHQGSTGPNISNDKHTHFA